MAINYVIVAGNLTRDPVLTFLQSGTAVCEFGIAINRKIKDRDKTVFLGCKAFGKTAEFVNQHFSKGKQIFISGELDYSEWTTKDGSKRNKVEILVERVQFMGPPDAPAERTPPKRREPAPVKQEEAAEDGDLPF